MNVKCRMSLPRQKNLQFQCDQSSAENFKISLAGEGDAMLSLIQLDLPQGFNLRAADRLSTALSFKT